MDRIVVELAKQSLQISKNTTGGGACLQETLDPVFEANARTEAVQIILSAVLASQTWRGLNRRKFQKLVAEAARTVPDDGPSSVMHHVLLTEARKVLNHYE